MLHTEGRMKRWPVTLLVVGVCSAVVHADVTIVQKMTLEGGAVAVMPGSGTASPIVTTRIKGKMGRTDVDTGAAGPVAANMSTIVDAATGQVIVLDHNRKTARLAPAGAKALAPPPLVSANGASTLMTRVGGVKPTGKSQTIDGLTCDEYAVTASANIVDIAGVREIPAVTAARQRRDERVIGPDLGYAGYVEEGMNDVAMVIKGSVWTSRQAPGAAEYREYQKALASAGLPLVTLGGSGLNMVASDKAIKAMQRIDGLPVLTVLGLSLEARGAVTDVKQTMVDTRMITKLLSVTTDAIGDEVFKVPDGYQIIK